MKKLLLFVLNVIFDFIRYALLVAGICLTVAGVVGIFTHNDEWLAFLIGGLFVLAIGMAATYYVAGKRKDGFVGTLIIDLITSLLPPW